MGVDWAVVLAAGRGTRLGELTRDVPKPMVAVANIPIIERIVAAIAAGGVRRVCLVTGYRAEALEAHVARVTPIPVCFVRQEVQSGTAGALRLTRGCVGDAPFLLSWGDIATAPEHFGAVTQRWDRGLDGVVGVNLVDDVSRFSSVVFDEAGVISAMIEKPQGEPPSYWNSSGIMALGPAIWPQIEAVEPSTRGEYEVPSAIAGLLAAGGRLVAEPLAGPWFDIGTPEGLAEASKSFEEG